MINNKNPQEAKSNTANNQKPDQTVGQAENIQSVPRKSSNVAEAAKSQQQDEQQKSAAGHTQMVSLTDYNALKEYAQTLKKAFESEKTQRQEAGVILTRMQQDFDNFRRRTADQQKKLKEDGVAEVLEKVIAIGDMLSQAISFTKDENTKSGLVMVLKQFEQTLSSVGATEIVAIGEKFNSDTHNAVDVEKTDDKSKLNTVASVIKKGYKLGDRIIRYSDVVIYK